MLFLHSFLGQWVLWFISAWYKSALPYVTIVYGFRNTRGDIFPAYIIYIVLHTPLSTKWSSLRQSFWLTWYKPFFRLSLQKNHKVGLKYKQLTWTKLRFKWYAWKRKGLWVWPEVNSHKQHGLDLKAENFRSKVDIPPSLWEALWKMA